MAFSNSGIQQLGIGVTNVYEAWDWYRENFGADVMLSDAPGEASMMQPYTNHQPQSRHTILAYNMQGGGGLEIWQYTSREPHKLEFQPKLGDLGTIVGKLKSPNVAAAYLKFKNSPNGATLLSSFGKNLNGKEHFFLKDPFGNFFEVVESDIVFKETNSKIGGIYGAICGVTDMEKSIEFYKNILGYDTVIYDDTDVFEDFKMIPGGEDKFRRVLLGHSEKRKGPFSNFLNESQIELVQLVNSDRKPRNIYDFEKHLWGDPGFIQICFDISNMKGLKKHCESYGLKFQCDSNPEAYENAAEIFDMGGASGHFTYIEDPDRNLIEFVETYYVPIAKKLHLGLNLRKKDPEKALPDFVMAGLKFLRKGADYSTSDIAKAKTAISDECALRIKAQNEQASQQNNNK